MESTYNHHYAEKAAQELWDKSKVYASENNSGPLYSIDTPPPTVSGSLHIGHIFSYTQADIIARYKRMSGFSVFYPIGFDDNGLATERFVEKKCDVSSFKMGRTAFIGLCLQVTQATEKQFEQLWRRMGLSFDWEAQYSTISPLARKISQASFIELYNKGYIYRKEEVAPYCPACRTSVAQAELDDVEKASTFNDIVFKTTDGTDLIIATTRPELLGSCVALFYNPQDSRYQHLAGIRATVPLFGYTVPILADEAVLVDKGTGLVMCCTFGDKTDVAWFKKYDLPYKPTIGRDGRMTAAAGQFAGKKVNEARALAIQALSDAGLLRSQRPIMHMVNIHERCKNDVELLALEQWFLDILSFKEKFIQMGDEIEWNPAFMKARYVDWVEHLGWDWCLSRQRFYGIPFPAWHCVDCDTILLADEAQLPVDPQETPYNKPCPRCNGTHIVPDTDVMDTWNTSSLTPYLCRELYKGDKTNFLPMSMRPQAHDIIRTWAFDTIVKTWMHDDVIPWKSIIISGHVLSGQGSKISKSQGNSPLEPENLLATYPADVIRYWTASASLGHDVAFSENQLKIGGKLVVKLWNAFRFMHEHMPRESQQIDPATIGLLNQWILNQVTSAARLYHYYFETYELGLALGAVERFFWSDFCDNYLELIKDQLFNPLNYSEKEVAATRWTLSVVGARLLSLYAPFIPHITETLYQLLFKTDQTAISLHQTRFDQFSVAYEFPESVSSMKVILDIVTAVRKLKSDKQLSLKTDLAFLIISGSQETITCAQAHESVFKAVSRAAVVSYQLSNGHAPSLEMVNGGWQAVVTLGAA